MNKQMKWLDNSLIRGPSVALCISEKQFLDEMWRRKAPQDQVTPWVSFAEGAKCHIFEDEHGGLIAIVCLGMPKQDLRTPVEIACILVHEAVHIWQEFKQYIGEKEPSPEFEAYSIQNISQALMNEYVRQSKALAVASK